jgi:hypothetical protein
MSVVTGLAKTFADGHSRRINAYVPAAMFAAEVSKDGIYSTSFGTPTATDADAHVTAAQVFQADAANTVTSFSGVLGGTDDARFGRNVICTAGAAVGASVTVVITVVGRDYLGQPMKENISIAHADGTNAIAGVKAFKWIDSVTSDGGTGGTTTDTTIIVGSGTKFGLPYKTMRVLSEENAGAQNSTLGTLTAGVVTDPATATTGDPRGLYVPNTTPNGVKEISGQFIASSWVNSSGNGGLYGIQHYYA